MRGQVADAGVARGSRRVEAEQPAGAARRGLLGDRALRQLEVEVADQHQGREARRPRGARRRSAGRGGLRERTRIEPVAQPLADQVEGDRRQRESGAGEEGDPPAAGERGAPVGDHVAPARGRRLKTEAEKGERRFVDDRRRGGERGFDERRRQRVGQQVAEDDPGAAGAGGARREDELAVAERAHLGAHQPRHRNPSGEAEDEDDGDDARAARSPPGRGAERAGERPAALRASARRRGRSPAGALPESAPRGTRDQADQQHGPAGDGERNPAAGEQARCDIAAELVAAEREGLRVDRPREVGDRHPCRPRLPAAARPPTR